MKLNIREFTDGKKVFFSDDKPEIHIMITPNQHIGLSYDYSNIDKVDFKATKISYETWLKQIKN